MQVVPTNQCVSLMRLPAVQARTGMSRSAIYAGMKTGSFPTCIKLGPRAIAWPSNDIDAFVSRCIANAMKG